MGRFLLFLVFLGLVSVAGLYAYSFMLDVNPTPQVRELTIEVE